MNWLDAATAADRAHRHVYADPLLPVKWQYNETDTDANLRK